MATILDHPQAQIIIVEQPGEQKQITVRFHQPQLYRHIQRQTCVTGYSLPLIARILEVKGPMNLCDEIMRDEDVSYAPLYLEVSLLGYLDASQFVGKRILDFGCGSGASLINLSRMFPESQIVGIELENDLLSIARMRVEHYQLDNVELYLSPGPSQIPATIGRFDFILLSAVYEHLLPTERPPILQQIWSVLNHGGVMFLEETPHRYWPMEGHTTRLPFVNYLPDSLALWAARHFSKRVPQQQSWQTLLRRGIRGGTAREILGILRRFPGKPKLLRPKQMGFADPVDLWYATPSYNEVPKIKRLLRLFAKSIYFTSGIAFTPSIFLAIQKRLLPIEMEP